MKRYLSVLIGFALWFLLLPTAQAIPDSNDDRLLKLNALRKQDLFFSTQCPADSVLSYIDQLMPELKDARDVIPYFELWRFKVNTLATRGDWITAINEATRLNDEAKERNNAAATAISSFAIGDTYHHIRMFDKALELYESALRTLKMINAPETLTYSLLLQTVYACVKDKEMQKADMYAQQLETMHIAPENQYPAAIHRYLCLALYYIAARNEQQAQHYIYLAMKENFATYLPENYARIQSFTGLFHSTFGHYQEAAEAYTKALSLPMSSGYYALPSLGERAKVHEIMGDSLAAFHDYQQAFALKDSIYQQSFTRQMNALRADNQINQMEMEEEMKKDRIISRLTLIIIVTMLAAFAALLHLWRDSKRLKAANEKKRNAIDGMGRSILSKSLFLANISQTVKESIAELDKSCLTLQQKDKAETGDTYLYGKLTEDATWLQKQINELLNASNVTSDNRKLESRPENIVSLCSEAIALAEQSLIECRVEFKTVWDEQTAPFVHTYRAQLVQVLAGLLSMVRRNTTGKEVRCMLEERPAGHVLIGIQGTELQIQERNLPEITLTNSLMIVKKLHGEMWIGESSFKQIRLYIQFPLQPNHRKA